MENNSLAQLRKRAGLTQQQLANKSGIPVKRISDYENGRCKISNITASKAVVLSEILDCTVRELIGE